MLQFIVDCWSVIFFVGLVEAIRLKQDLTSGQTESKVDGLIG